MFCPDCGLEDKQSNQFCRACGTDLRPVRHAVERPDSVTESAVSARDEIGRAIAARFASREARRNWQSLPKKSCPKSKNFSSRRRRNVFDGCGSA
jgi:hypothetical protein